MGCTAGVSLLLFPIRGTHSSRAAQPPGISNPPRDAHAGAEAPHAHPPAGGLGRSWGGTIGKLQTPDAGGSHRWRYRGVQSPDQPGSAPAPPPHIWRVLLGPQGEGTPQSTLGIETGLHESPFHLLPTGTRAQVGWLPNPPLPNPGEPQSPRSGTSSSPGVEAGMGALRRDGLVGHYRAEATSMGQAKALWEVTGERGKVAIPAAGLTLTCEPTRMWLSAWVPLPPARDRISSLFRFPDDFSSL